MNEQSEQKNEVRLEGILRAYRRDSRFEDKPFLGAEIECKDGTLWIITYEEDSPFHRFADRQVVVSGEPYEPTGQHLISDGGKLGHFHVSSIRLAEGT
jgi:hypothetical protein